MMQSEQNCFESILKSVFMEGLLKVQKWFLKKDAIYLRSIFDQVGFMDIDAARDVYYVPPLSLASATTKERAARKIYKIN